MTDWRESKYKNWKEWFKSVEMIHLLTGSRGTT